MPELRYATHALNRMSPDELRDHQQRRLLQQIDYCYGTSAFYRKRFAEIGVEPGDIRSLDDYFAMPVLMDKEQERRSQEESMAQSGHPFGAHICSRPEDVAITATTSGTTGRPTFTYTLGRPDVDLLSPGIALMMGHAGISPGERVLFAFALGIYATSVALPPLRRSGVLPVDVDVRGGADMILQFADMTRPVAAMTTPSLIQHLIDRIPQTLGKQPADLGLRALCTVGEIGVGVPSVKARIEQAYGCRIYDWIAPVGQTLAFSCDSDEYHGMHAVTPDNDLYPLDLVDPETRQHIPITDGVEGEAIYTSLQRTTLPVLRYASGDIVQVFTDPCPGCGFTGARLRVVGRSDDMLIVKGVNVYPGAIKRVVASFVPEVTGELRIVLDGPPPAVTPPLTVRIEHGEGVDAERLRDLERRILHELHTKVRVTPTVEWVAPGTLERGLAKTPMYEKRY